MSVIPVNLAVEDDLSEAVLRRLLAEARRGYQVGTVYGRSGFGYLKRTIAGWNRGARGIPFIVLTDLDNAECPATLISEWLSVAKHPNLLLRVAVREVEAWLLADSMNLARALKCGERLIPAAPDSIPDPKKSLIAAATRSRSTEIRSRVVPRAGSTAQQGPDYNSFLSQFVLASWNPDEAAERSPSLKRTRNRFAAFAPTWDAL